MKETYCETCHTRLKAFDDLYFDRQGEFIGCENCITTRSTEDCVDETQTGYGSKD